MIQPKEWLLLFIGLPSDKFETDQLRVMKGIFLFTKEGPTTVRHIYKFTPYDYGPFAMPVYGDLDALEGEGFIRKSYVIGANQRVFSLTTRGEQWFRKLIAKAPKDALQSLREVKARVTSLNFADLLAYVYGKYPHYASRSLFRK